MFGRPSTAAVFLREARRSSRRWQTYALRFAFAAVVFVTLVILTTATDLGDPAKSAEFGRTLFQVYAGTQMAVVGLLAPLLVGLGVAEEREEGTLQLLLVTKLSTVQILWGKVISRLLVLTSFIIGGLPVLALIASFGGVGPWEVLSVTGNTLLVALVLGSLGGVAALFSGGGAVALGAATLWAFGNWFLLPFAVWGLAAGGSGSPTPTLALFAPPAAMFESSWRSVAPLATNLPVIALLIHLTTPLFRLVTSRSVPSLEGDLEDDEELAGVARLQRRVGVIALLVPLFAATSIATAVLLHGRRFGPHSKAGRALFDHLTFGLIAQPQLDELGRGLIYGTAVLMMMLSATAIALVQLRIAGLLKQVFGGGGGSVGLLTSVLRAFDSIVRPVRLPVWPLPAAWRDVSTRGGGGPPVLSRWMTFPLIIVMMFTLCLGMGDQGDDTLWAVGILTLLATYVVTLLLGITTFTSERQRRTLSLFVTTTHSMPRLVLGKLLGVLINGTVWIGVSLTLIATAAMVQRQPYGAYGYGYGYGSALNQGPTCSFPAMGASAPWLDALSYTAWGAGVWWFIIGLSLLAGLRSRPSRGAFPIVIGILIIAPAVTLLGLLILNLDDVAQALFPIFDPPSPWDPCHGNWLTLLGAGALAATGTGLIGIVLVRARAWILSDAS